ncbi:hypothetical protein L1987_06915 [Smallanthus sonchifolius]|uniref:Uncharacterized protein n=1 Tax=Smallanthus sonchifolius TaxID=185202 RepID=A0ACB9JZN2_9ASTR|nr:hypothetical protein L1987_06915 [Smallanthus sonchifolius]
MDDRTKDVTAVEIAEIPTTDDEAGGKFEVTVFGEELEFVLIVRYDQGIVGRFPWLYCSKNNIVHCHCKCPIAKDTVLMFRSVICNDALIDVITSSMFASS